MKLHHTRGVYDNGDFKDNFVRPADLESHIEYNKTFRWGRALLVDGVIVYNGYLSDERLAEHVGVVRTATKDSRPYR